MRAVRISMLASLLLIISMMISCNSLLEVEGKGNITGDVFTTEEGIIRALNGAYFNLAGINDGVDGGELLGGDFILIPSLLIVENVFEMNWDDINGAAYSDFYERNILATNSRVEGNWRRAYETINTLNSILQNLDNLSTAERNRVEGEALAMRAILYFEMARLWGPEYVAVGGNPTLDVEVLPLLLEPVEIPGSSPAFNTIDEIYTQVLTDLTDASVLLEPLGLNGTNISYFTCQAYLMRLAMHMDDFSAAIQHADNITDAGIFSLTSTPQEAFNNFTNSSEDIFAIQQTASYNSGNISTGTGLVNYYASLNGQGLGALRISPFYLNNLFDDFTFSPEYSDNDLRGIVDNNVTNQSTAGDVSGAFYTNLLNDVTVSPSKYMASDRVLPVIRLAEVLLARAEAKAFLNPIAVDQGALDDYNAIRTRAGLSPLLASDFAIGIDLLDSIIVEKRREFLYEGVLYHDMKRRNESINGISLDNARFTLPIPQSELNVRQ
jgi:hypothetical protein